MKILRVCVLICGLAAGFYLSHPPAAAAADDELILKARTMIDALQRGECETATRDFDATMRSVSGPEKTGEFWNILQTKVGAFKERTGERREKLGN